MTIFDLLNGTAMNVCMSAEDGGGAAGGGGEPAGDTGGGEAGGDAGGGEPAGNDGGDAGGEDDAATKNAPDDGSDGDGTPDGDDGDDNADNDKTKEDSDADDEKGEGDDDGDEDDGTNEPLTIEDFEFPEGVEVDEEMMGEFLEIANDSELSEKERSQKLVSLYTEKQQKAVEAQYQSWEDQRNAWKTEAKKDKEIGGEAFEENLAHAQKALAHFGSKELKEFGDQYGWADHPEYLRMLVRVGKTLREDNSTGNAGKGGDSQTPIENRWYGADDKN